MKKTFLFLIITFFAIFKSNAQNENINWVTNYVDLYMSEQFEELEDNFLGESFSFLESSSSLLLKNKEQALDYWDKTFSYIKDGSFHIKQTLLSGNNFVVIQGKAKFSYQAQALGVQQEEYMHFDIPMTIILKVENKKVIHQADYTDSKIFMKQLNEQIKK